MNDQTLQLQAAQAVRARTRFESAAVGLRLARSIAARFGIATDSGAANGGMDSAFDPAQRGLRADREALIPALRFAFELAAGCGVRLDNEAQWRDEVHALRAARLPHPLSRIASVSPFAPLNDLIADLVLLSGLPELHEGYAALCRLLHPQGLPYPTVTLALHWLEHEAAGEGPVPDEPIAALDRALAVREPVENLLMHSSLARIGLVRLEGEGPWHGRTLRPGPGVWDGLNARAPRLSRAELVPGFRTVPGLESWLAQADVQRAIRVMKNGEPCLIALLGESDAMRATRVRALLGSARMGAVRTRLASDMSAEARAEAAVDAYCAAFMHCAYPWLDIGAEADGPPFSPASDMSWDLPVVISVTAERALPLLDLPIVMLRIEPLAASARRKMWGALLPQLADCAGVLAARYPIDPDEAKGIVTDLALRQRTSEHPEQALDLDDIGACLRSRTGWRARPGVRRVIPRADWKQVLVPEHAATQLTEAVLRIHQQLTVLDDWGFEQGRNDRRGLRLLFYGPPGTGKTLAAEAMAKALGIDLLAVDIASLVSKWIGETEKNLAAVFELAESSRALLLFDEADALFGRRTDVNDAHDRYANLETAFLLQRLERYEGIAILATNLRASLDAAFTRRFEFIVEFPEPDLATRAKLWRLHLPAGAPLAGDVDLHELAEWYLLSGAQIRNAALGAAFLAAAEEHGHGKLIRQRHFLRAIEREFEKAGKAHPGNPPARSTVSAPGQDQFQQTAAGVPGPSISAHRQ